MDGEPFAQGTVISAMDKLKRCILLLTLLCSVALANSSWGDSRQALFAGGCFWCMEADFEKLPGVLSVTSGYTGGNTANPNYKAVSRGGTGHYEAVNINYDPTVISYAQLLEVFWRNIDPYDDRGQFCDKGESYRSAIFTGDETEARLARQSKKQAQETLATAQPLVTSIVEASEFYPAEEYHQDYYKKNPVRYKYYRWNCGRDQRLEALWGAAQ